MQRVSIALRINTAGQQRHTFYSRSASLPSAGQQRNTNQATLNHNVAEIEIQRKTRGKFRHNTPAEQHRPYIFQQSSIAHVYISAEQHRPGSGYPWEWRPQTDEKYRQVNPRTSEHPNN